MQEVLFIKEASEGEGVSVQVYGAFPIKDALKAAGYRWDGEGKRWSKDVPATVQALDSEAATILKAAQEAGVEFVDGDSIEALAEKQGIKRVYFDGKAKPVWVKRGDPDLAYRVADLSVRQAQTETSSPAPTRTPAQVADDLLAEFKEECGQQWEKFAGGPIAGSELELSQWTSLTTFGYWLIGAGEADPVKVGERLARITYIFQEADFYWYRNIELDGEIDLEGQNRYLYKGALAMRPYLEALYADKEQRRALPTFHFGYAYPSDEQVQGLQGLQL